MSGYVMICEGVGLGGIILRQAQDEENWRNGAITAVILKAVADTAME